MNIRVVLMVEDNPGDARLLREMFKERGSSDTEVVHVERMKEAEDYLATHTVDLILLDLGLPDAQGSEGVRRARAAAPRTALVVLSGLEDEAVALQAMQEGAQDYLVKGRLETTSILRALRFAMERKHLEEALYIEKERAQVTLDSIGDAVISIDASGSITSLNLVAERMTGCSRQEAVRRPVGEVLRMTDADSRVAIPNPMELAISPEQIVRRPANCLLIRRDGYEIPIHDVVSPIHDRDGRATGSVIVFRDVSEPRAMELWMQRAKTELERSNRELQEFASVASHDLQEPLRKIRAFGDRLAQRTEGALDDDSRADLERIQGAAARMQALIDDLLEYALVTTRARAFRPVDLGAVAAEVVEDLVERLERTGGRVEVGPLPIIEADPTQMRQLLQNLLGNGLKFQREGVPPLVRLSAGPAAGIVGRGESVALTVSDNGIGFEARHAERIFAPFERLHGRTAYEGTGIGLAICHKIVERHAGDITASGRPGEGAIFTVILPLRQATPAGQALPTVGVSLGLPLAVSV